MEDRRTLCNRIGAGVTELPIEAGPVSLRKWRRSDTQDLVQQANNRAVWRNMTHLFPHPYRVADANAWIDACLADDPPGHLVIGVDGRFAGVCGVDIGRGVGAHAGRIGYWLGEAYWGRGHATAALAAFLRYVWDTFQVERLQTEVFAWNPASARVLEKNGFELEGTRRKAICKDGDFVDEWIYSLLRSESEL